MYSSKDVKRSIRAFKNASKDILNSAWYLFESRFDRLFFLIENDDVIKQIVGPYLEMKLSHPILDYLTNTSFVSIKIPPDPNQEIAMVLQTVKHLLSTDALRSVDRLTHNNGLTEFKMQFLVPVFRELDDRLNYLLEEKIENEDKVTLSSLNIINIGTFRADNSTVGMGSDIKQVGSSS